VIRNEEIKNLEPKTARVLIKEYIDSNSVLQTDRSITFSDLSDFIDVHVRENQETAKVISTSDGFTL
jgi:hypothetical protein